MLSKFSTVFQNAVDAVSLIKTFVLVLRSSHSSYYLMRILKVLVLCPKVSRRYLPRLFF